MIPTTGGIGSTPACHGLRAPKPDGACILLAEDDAPFRKLLSSVLEGDGHRVVQAADGAELLERLAETATRAGCKPRRLDLVITDLRMPGMSGIDALEYLRAGPWAATPVVVMTAFSDDAIHAQAARLGILSTLDKPFPPDRLRRLVRTILA